MGEASKAAVEGVVLVACGLERCIALFDLGALGKDGFIGGETLAACGSVCLCSGDIALGPPDAAFQIAQLRRLDVQGVLLFAQATQGVFSVLEQSQEARRFNLGICQLLAIGRLLVQLAVNLGDILFQGFALVFIGSGLFLGQIFELIVKADEKLKYATTDTEDVRRRQARELLVQARAEAAAIGNDALVRQAETRLADLDLMP